MNSTSRDSYVINHIVWNSISIVSHTISLVVSFSILSQMNIFYGTALIASAIPSSIVAAKSTKLLYGLNLEQINGQRRMGYIQSIATERMYAQDFRLFNILDKLKIRYTRIWEELFIERRTATRKRTILVCLLECLPEVVTALIGVDIAFRVLAGNGTVGDYSLIIGLAAQLMGAISVLSFCAMQIYDNRMKLDNFRTIQKLKNRVKDTGTRTLSAIDSIEFIGVSFSYPGSTEKALNNICCCMHKDEKIALVGLNGSGKSTIIKLLLRLYDPDEGVILINDYDIREYSLASLRENFSVYFQEMHNLSFTLLENFAITDNQTNCEGIEKDIHVALNTASCSDIIEKCKDGLDTSITRIFSDDGIELSGGQHQKLALARALFRRHTAMVLDEPSSNLDPKAEHEVFTALKKLTDGKMTIFTSHRLSNVFLADRIIVLENGQIVEDGTQKELLKNKQRFAELYNYQSEKFALQSDD